MNNRIDRLKFQYQFAAQGVKAKIEMRKNRVPKRYWNKTLREVQAMQGSEKERKIGGMLGLGQFQNIPRFTIPQE